MTRLIWGEASNRMYDAGVSQGVLYPSTGPGVAWNGLVSVVESPEDAINSIQHLDGQKYRNGQSGGSFAATIEAYTYPKEFLPYDGTEDRLLNQQRRKSFGFSYRDLNKLHLVYNALAAPTEHNNQTIGDSTEASIFSWDITTTPVPIAGNRATAHLVIDPAVAHPWTVEALEAALYGSVGVSPGLPQPSDVIALFEVNSILRVTDNGDGSFTVTGPDEVILMTNPTTFEITWPSALYIDEVSYKISSL